MKNKKLKLKKLGRATKTFPVQMSFNPSKCIRHKSINEDDMILLTREGKDIIVYKVLNYNPLK